MREVTEALLTRLQPCRSISRMAGQFWAKDKMARPVTWVTLFSFNYDQVSPRTIRKACI